MTESLEYAVRQLLPLRFSFFCINSCLQGRSNRMQWAGITACDRTSCNDFVEIAKNVCGFEESLGMAFMRLFRKAAPFVLLHFYITILSCHSFISRADCPFNKSSETESESRAFYP